MDGGRKTDRNAGDYRETITGLDSSIPFGRAPNQKPASDLDLLLTGVRLERQARRLQSQHLAILLRAGFGWLTRRRKTVDFPLPAQRGEG